MVDVVFANSLRAAEKFRNEVVPGAVCLAPSSNVTGGRADRIWLLLRDEDFWTAEEVDRTFYNLNMLKKPGSVLIKVEDWQVAGGSPTIWPKAEESHA